MLSTHSSQGLTVKRDAVAYGSVLLAEKAFKPGEKIAHFDDARRAPQSYLTVQVGTDEHVELDLLGNLNHSCRPNVVIDAQARTVTACRAIAPGEQLTFFYPSTEWQMDRPFRCQCGQPECIGFVAGARFLSPDLMSRYYINAHVIGQIVESLACGKVSS